MPRTTILKCPRGKVLRPQRLTKHGRFFYSKAKDCSRCSMANLRLSAGRRNKGCRGERPSSCPPSSASPTGELIGRGQANLPARSLALRRIPRRGKDLAWARARNPTRSSEHPHPGVPDRRGREPEEAGVRSIAGVLDAGPSKSAMVICISLVRPAFSPAIISPSSGKFLSGATVPATMAWWSSPNCRV